MRILWRQGACVSFVTLITAAKSGLHLECVALRAFISLRFNSGGLHHRQTCFARRALQMWRKDTSRYLGQ